MAIHLIVHTLSIGIRVNYKKKELDAVCEGAGDNEIQITQDHDYYDGKNADDTNNTNVQKDMILDKEKKYAQSKKEKMTMLIMAVNQENQVKIL